MPPISKAKNSSQVVGENDDSKPLEEHDERDIISMIDTFTDTPKQQNTDRAQSSQMHLRMQRQNGFLRFFSHFKRASISLPTGRSQYCSSQMIDLEHSDIESGSKMHGCKHPNKKIVSACIFVANELWKTELLASDIRSESEDDHGTLHAVKLCCFGCNYAFLKNIPPIGHSRGGLVRLGRCLNTRSGRNPDLLPVTDVPLDCTTADSWKNSQQKKMLAIKELRKKHKEESEDTYLRKIVEEFQIAKGLDHPHLVRTVGLSIDASGRWYSIMEHCTGGDLYAYMCAGGLKDSSHIASVFKQIVIAVGHLHSSGIVHRDLKPENVFIDGSGIVRLGDLDICARADDSEKGYAGSEPYMPPEVHCLKESKERHLSEEKKADAIHARKNSKYTDQKAVDIWALGIILFALYQRSLPWNTADSKRDHRFMEYLDCLLRNDMFRPFSKLLSQQRSLLTLLLDPDPHNRPSIEETLNDPWLRSVEVRAVPLNPGLDDESSEIVEEFCVNASQSTISPRISSSQSIKDPFSHDEDMIIYETKQHHLNGMFVIPLTKKCPLTSSRGRIGSAPHSRKERFVPKAIPGVVDVFDSEICSRIPKDWIEKVDSEDDD
jgi:serine/threonine protein kinase